MSAVVSSPPALRWLCRAIFSGGGCIYFDSGRQWSRRVVWWVPGGGIPFPFPRCVGREYEFFRLSRWLRSFGVLRDWVQLTRSSQWSSPGCGGDDIVSHPPLPRVESVRSRREWIDLVSAIIIPVIACGCTSRAGAFRFDALTLLPKLRTRPPIGAITAPGCFDGDHISLSAAGPWIAVTRSIPSSSKGSFRWCGGRYYPI